MKDIRDAFFERLIDGFDQSKNLVLLSVDMGSTVLKEAGKTSLGARIINVGVSEANAVMVAGGLAAKGMLPVVYGISSFLVHRARAQLRHDIAINRRKIILVGSGPGLVYAEDGPSHHCLDDISSVRGLPGFRIFTPWDGESGSMAAEAALQSIEPCYVRLDKGQGQSVLSNYEEVATGCWVKTLTKGRRSDKVVVTSTAYIYGNELVQDADVLRLFEISESTCPALREVLRGYKEIHVADESYSSAGVFSLVCESMVGIDTCVIDLTFQSKFVQEKWPREKLGYLYRS